MIRILLVIIICLVFSRYAYADSNKLSALDEYVIGWQIGEEIIPYPPTFGDCDDVALYSYLYLHGLQKDIDIKIMIGKNPWSPKQCHVWIDVSDNQSHYVYDYGFPVNPEEYKGREISYTALLNHARADRHRIE